MKLISLKLRFKSSFTFHNLAFKQLSLHTLIISRPDLYPYPVDSLRSTKKPVAPIYSKLHRLNVFSLPTTLTHCPPAALFLQSTLTSPRLPTIILINNFPHWQSCWQWSMFGVPNTCISYSEYSCRIDKMAVKYLTGCRTLWKQNFVKCRAHEK